MKATLKNYRQSPRKIRLLADLVKGKKANEAKVVLDFTNKRASKVLSKMIDSALANAKENSSLNPEDLYVKNIKVDEGYTLKRIRPRAMGRAFRIRKRTSHIDVILDKIENKLSKVKSSKKEKKESLKKEVKTRVKKETKKETKPKKK